MGESTAHPGTDISQEGRPLPSPSLSGQRQAGQQTRPHDRRHHIDHQGGAQITHREYRACRRRGGEIHQRLHGGIEAVVPHELVLRDQLGNGRVHRRGLDAGPQGTEERHDQQAAQQGRARWDVGKRRDHSQGGAGNQDIRSDDECLSVVPVRPNTA